VLKILNRFISNIRARRFLYIPLSVDIAGAFTVQRCRFMPAKCTTGIVIALIESRLRAVPDKLPSVYYTGIYGASNRESNREI